MLKKFSLALCMALFAALIPAGAAAYEEAVTLPADIDPIPQIMVSVRVEGLNETLFHDYGVIIYEGMTVLDTLLSLDIDVVYDVTDAGAWISGISGAMTDDVHAWMYAVNRELPTVSMDEFVLSDGGELVVSLLNWQYGSFAFFTPSIVEVLAGESTVLTLEALHYATGLSPAAGALLDIVSDSPTDRMFRYTDADGSIELSFPHAGRYYISASLYNDDGVNTLSRPLSLWLVGPSALELETGQEITISTGTPLSPWPNAHVLSNTVWYQGRYIEPALQIFTCDNGDVMVPFRAVVEELMGGIVEWDGGTSLIRAEFSGIEISFPIDYAGINIIVVNDRVFIPIDTFVDFIADSF